MNRAKSPWAPDVVYFRWISRKLIMCPSISQLERIFHEVTLNSELY